MELRGERVRLRPTTRADRAALKAIRDEPEVARWWDVQTDAWPDDADDLELHTIEFDDEVVGLVQFWEEPDADYRHADVDILLTTRLHGQGLGTDAMRAITRHLIDDRGHHRITIDPALGNDAAIRCYAAVGFRPVGVLRDYERDVDGAGWHDGLMMELLDSDRPAT